MPTPRHDDRNLVINIFLAALLASSNLQRCALADGTSTLGGDAYRIYNSTTTVDADLTAGELSAAHAAGLKAALTQQPAPTDVIAVKYDDAGGEDPSDAFATLLAQNVEFLGFSCTSTDTADILAAMNAIEADKKHVGSFRTTDTTGLPAALAAAADYDYSMCVYHEAAEEVPFSHLASRLSFDPERSFAMGPGRVKGFTENTLIDATVEAALVADNISFMAPFGTASQFIDDAYMLSGRGLEEMVTVIVTERRMHERAAQLYLTYSDLGLALAVGLEGQTETDSQVILAGEAVEPVLEQLLGVGRLLDFSVSFPAISASDIANANIPLNVDITLARSARKITINLYFSN